ncbi:MAG: ACT domain-containing protein [Elusimicrobia bacterium]|nr:ACT domain-containing protein [Elusimicrobiota bacterium]
MDIQIVRQYSVFLPNKPGTLSAFVKLFFDSGINIIGVASEIRDDSGIVRIAVEGDKKISYILTKAGFTTVETPLLSINVPDKPGQLYKLTKMLGDAGINITTVYGTAIAKKNSRMLFSVNHPEKAKELLKKFKG